MTEARKIIILCLWGIFCLTSLARAESEAQIYRKAVQAAKTGRTDFAFMYYSALSRNYPDSRYRREFLFARGEYLFWMPNYPEAAAAFETFLKDFPDADGKLVVWGYLYRIAQIRKDSVRMEEIKKEIIGFQQVGLVFKEFKENQYRSPMHYAYRVVFHIDKVEFYREGGLFAEVSY